MKLARFSFDGERVITAASAPDHAVRIWQTPTAEAGIPDWLPVLAETVAGLSVDPHGSTKLVPEKDFEALKQRLTGLTGDDRCLRVARWFFADRTTRTISPFQSETVPEYVQRRIEDDTRESLREATLLSAANALAFARYAENLSTVQKAGPYRADPIPEDAEWFSRYATNLAPNDPEILQIRASVMEQLGRAESDRRAARLP